MEAVSNTEKNQQTQQITPTESTTPKTEGSEEKKGESSFDSVLKSILRPDQANQVSEEALFASIVQERIASLKGDEVGTSFSAMIDKHKSALAKPDGYIPLEDAAKGALKELRSGGKITAEEADKIYSQAFAAAQLDSNTEALFDDRGGGSDTTVAVSAVDAAIVGSKALVEKFDAGSEQVTMRSLDEASNSKGAAGGVVVSGGVTVTGGTTGSGEVTTPQGTTVDGADNFLYKPVSNNEGTLAVLLPAAFKNMVTGVVLKDQAGQILDEGHSTGFGDTGEREKFAFGKPGGDYPDNLTVEVQFADGTTQGYLIPDSSQRYD